VAASNDHYLVPIDNQSHSFLNLSPRELVAICNTTEGKGIVWTQESVPRSLSPFAFESGRSVEKALVQYCMYPTATSHLLTD
jgi:hypothetical protein